MQSFKRFGACVALLQLVLATTNAYATAAPPEEATSAEDQTAAEPSRHSAAYLPPKPASYDPHKAVAAETPFSSPHRADVRYVNDAYRPDPYSPYAGGPYPYIPAAAAAFPYPQQYHAAAGPYPYAAAVGPVTPYPHAPAAGPYPYAAYTAAGPYAFTAAGPYASTAAGPYASTAAGPYASTAAGPAYGFTAAGPYASTAAGPAYAYPPVTGPYGPAFVPQAYNTGSAPGVTAPAAHSAVSHASFSSGPYGAHYSYKR